MPVRYYKHKPLAAPSGKMWTPPKDMPPAVAKAMCKGERCGARMNKFEKAPNGDKLRCFCKNRPVGTTSPKSLYKFSRCRRHGGHRQTPEGRANAAAIAKGNQNATKHGFYSQKLGICSQEAEDALLEGHLGTGLDLSAQIEHARLRLYQVLRSREEQRRLLESDDPKERAKAMTVKQQTLRAEVDLSALEQGVHYEEAAESALDTEYIVVRHAPNYDDLISRSTNDLVKLVMQQHIVTGEGEKHSPEAKAQLARELLAKAQEHIDAEG